MSKTEKENLKKLLLSNDEANHLLGVQLLQHYEVDEDIRAIMLYLLMIYDQSSELFKEFWQILVHPLAASEQYGGGKINHYQYNFSRNSIVHGIELIHRLLPVNLQPTFRTYVC